MKLAIYHALGEEVKVLVNQNMNPGVFQTDWDDTNHYNQGVASGVYFYRVIAQPMNGGEPYVETRKMLLLK